MKKTLVSIALSCAFLTPAALMGATKMDHDLEKAIKDSYTFRAVLDGKVKVDVDEGVATLKGKVRDDEQSRLAVDTASAFNGITAVNNKIKVEDNSKPGSDEWIALKIRSRLAAKANVSFTNTKVDVRNGVVFLTGTAESTAQKDLTEEYVKDIDGVNSVTNNIQVVTKAEKENEKADRDHDRDHDRDGRTVGDKMDDSSITAQIKYELFSHRSTSALKTKVNTVAGHVIISGDADSDAQKDLVTKLAKSVRGVDSVDNNMSVRK